MAFSYFLLTFVLVVVNSQKFPADEYDDHFNCIQDAATNDWICCGYNALGERHCSSEDEWEKFEGKFRRCVKSFPQNVDGRTLNSPADLVGTDWDMCCDAYRVKGNGGDPSYANNCGVCKQFYVWPWSEYSAMEGPSTLSQEWRDDFLAQNLQDNDGFDNQVYPAGFQKATLREFNDPNVCVYVPYAAGKMIEVKVEADEFGDRICIGDVHDEETDRNDPGQNDACGPTQVKTCFGDATILGDDVTDKDEWGFAFYVFCDEACKEGGGSGDVPLWLRARFSEESWLAGNDNAETNVEMWCEYVVRDYPEYDVYPTDLSLSVDPIVQPDDDSSSFLAVVLLFGSLLLFL